ncbi:MAG: ABC transporter permease [Deltaproteobacteria bacterium]|nr:ABC transporter permease [Deltaproteobacteria bacterium]
MIASRIEAIGARVVDYGRIGIDLWKILIDTIHGTFRGNRPAGEVVNQMYVIGNKSLAFVAVTMGFIGMVMVYQSCLQLNRITGDLSQVGPEFLKLLIQDFAPTITSMMLATRVGAGIAAEVGSMKVTEQVDALRMSGITPVNYIIVPRFIASVVMTFVMVIFSVVVTFGAGGLTAMFSFGVNQNLFFDISRVQTFDILIGAWKTLCYGIAIPVISGFCGLRARGSSEGVGQATTAAVIGSSFAVILIGFFISGVALILRMAGVAD